MSIESIIRQMESNMLFVVTVDPDNNDLCFFARCHSIDVAQKKAKDEVSSKEATESVVVSTRNQTPHVVYRVYLEHTDGLEYRATKKYYLDELPFEEWAKNIIAEGEKLY